MAWHGMARQGVHATLSELSRPGPDIGRLIQQPPTVKCRLCSCLMAWCPILSQSCCKVRGALHAWHCGWVQHPSTAYQLTIHPGLEFRVV